MSHTTQKQFSSPSATTLLKVAYPSSENILIPSCDCEWEAALRTSWTSNNPSRRFLTCKLGKCHFWRWYDRELTIWERAAFNHLLKKLKEVEELVTDKHEELEVLKNEVRCLMLDLERISEQVNAKMQECNNLRVEVEKFRERANGANRMIYILLFIILFQFVVSVWKYV